jgi:hypothetical protein
LGGGGGGGLWFVVLFRKLFSDNTRARILIFLSRKSRNFFPGYNVRLYDKYSESDFLTSWKIAHVIAIFKKGDKSLPSNYRPISLISCVGKIIERVIYKYVFSHLQRNKLLLSVVDLAGN